MGHELVHGVGAERDGAEMQALEDHLVLGERARLVREHVGDAAELLAHGARADERGRYGLVVLYEPRVDGLGHVQVDAQADRNDVGEEEYEAEEVAEPEVREALERHHHRAQQDHREEEQLRQVVDLLVEQAELE